MGCATIVPIGKWFEIALMPSASIKCTTGATMLGRRKIVVLVIFRFLALEINVGSVESVNVHFRGGDFSARARALHPMLFDTALHILRLAFKSPKSIDGFEVCLQLLK